LRIDVVLQQVRTVAHLDLPQGVADQPCDIEHRRRIPQLLLAVAGA
jgi:hypothetical protein